MILLNQNNVVLIFYCLVPGLSLRRLRSSSEEQPESRPARARRLSSTSVSSQPSRLSSPRADAASAARCLNKSHGGGGARTVKVSLPPISTMPFILADLAQERTRRGRQGQAQHHQDHADLGGRLPRLLDAVLLHVHVVSECSSTVQLYVGTNRDRLRTTFISILAKQMSAFPFRYWLAPESYEHVDYRVRKFLFLFACANSCVNPLIYGVFSAKTSAFGNAFNSRGGQAGRSAQQMAAAAATVRQAEVASEVHVLPPRWFSLRRSRLAAVRQASVSAATEAGPAPSAAALAKQLALERSS